MNRYYLILISLFILIMQARKRRLAIVKHISNKKKNKEKKNMKELAKQFINHDCIIYMITSDSGSIQGIIKEITDDAMIVERKIGELEIINLEYVTRIREYPTNKNGKKKSIILD